MTVKDMHYDFKQKLNKIDSNQNRNLRVPEIDWKLNEAQGIFVKIIAEPRFKSELGFEVNQRTIDDIRTIVVNQKPNEYLSASVYDDSSFIVSLPENYWFYIASKAIATKGNCEKKLTTRLMQHDDLGEDSPFDKSSFEWRVSNYRFISEGIRLFTDGTFEINKLALDYIRTPKYIHNAEDYGGSYNKPDGTVLTGTQDCELPKGVHSEIVDLAVLITTGDLNSPDYAAKQAKLKLTQ